MFLICESGWERSFPAVVWKTAVIDMTSGHTSDLQTIEKQMQAKLAEIKCELRRRLHHFIPSVGRWLRSVAQGHFQVNSASYGEESQPLPGGNGSKRDDKYADAYQFHSESFPESRNRKYDALATLRSDDSRCSLRSFCRWAG